MPSHSGIYFAEFLPRREITDYPVVFLHGAGSNHLFWPSSLRRMRNIHTLSVDLPGHGKSEPPGRQSVEQYSQIICEWLLRLDIRKLVLVGSGLGGNIALRCAAERKDQINAVILINPVLPHSIPTSIIDDLRNSVTAAYGVREVIQKIMRVDPSNECMQPFLNNLCTIRPTVLAGDILAWSTSDYADLIAPLSQPVCILEGNHHQRTLHAALQQINTSNSKIFVHSDSANSSMLPLENPGWVAEQIVAFLQQDRSTVVYDPFTAATYTESYIPQESRYAV